mmetsp:Transcript_29436/g.62668  ORF Transcript_29436/g.62668 Transcript_29436/m.62668 type:complete len:291 (+) Transcript_29436:78-950(+)
MVARGSVVGVVCAALLIAIPAAGAPEGAVHCGRSNSCASEGLVLLQARQSRQRTNTTETVAQFLAEDVELSRSFWQQEGSAFLGYWRSRMSSAMNLLKRNQFYQPGSPVVATPSGPSPATPTPEQAVGYSFITAAVYILFMCAVGFLYLKIKEAPQPEMIEEQQESHGFQFGIFDTTKCSVALAFWSCCCCPLRWADTASSEKLKIIGFWPAVLLMTGLIGFSDVPVLGGLLTLVTLGVVLYFRQRIREHYSIERGTCMTLFEDCLCYTFCGPCAVAQEARQLEYVEAKQ